MKKLLCSIGLLAFLILVFSLDVYAQYKPMHYDIGLTTALGSNGRLPFWLSSNRFGIYDPNSQNLLINLSLSTDFDENKNFDYSYGIDAIGRASGHTTFFLNQAYFQVKLGAFLLRGGRAKEKLGTVGSDLSSGPMMWSGNAAPMPKISLSIPEYTTVPYTWGFVEVKGYYAHGWFEHDRYVKEPYLHQKMAYLRLGGKNAPFNFFGGMMHNAMWGGTSSNPDVGELPQGLSDYWDVITGSSGNSDAPGGEIINALGNHLGTYEAGINFDIKSYTILVHKYFLFEDGTGLRMRSPQDGLLGISIQDKRKDQLISGFIWEFIYSKAQSGPALPDPPPAQEGQLRDPNGDRYGGRDNYFNNYIYRDGWSYFGRLLGNPLFTYDPQTNKVINNRIVAHHIGLEGKYRSYNYRLFYTYSRNYGRYGSPLAGSENEYLVQNSFMVEMKKTLSSDLVLNITAAADFGKLYKNSVGLLVGLYYKGIFD